MFTTAKILITPTKRGWTQVYEENGLVALLSLEGSDEESAVELGKKAGEAFEKSYNESKVESPLSRLKEAKTKTEEEFKKNNLSIAASSVSDKNLIYFVRTGDTQIWANRTGTIYNLKGEGFSGKIQEGDIFILGTSAFFNSIKPDILDEAFQGKTPLEITESLSPQAHRTDNPRAGAVVIKPSLPQLTPAPKDSLLRRLLVRFALMLPERNFNAKRVSGKDPAVQAHSKTAISIGIVLLVILIASIFLGVRQKKANDYKASYQDRLVRAENLFNDALAQKETNLINARELYKSAQDIV